jgi:general secretion pathway protein D
MRRLQGIASAATLLLATTMLANCSYLSSDSCADQANLPKSEFRLRGCDGGFFSAQKQRETSYLGDDSARLWTGAEYRRDSNIDPTAVNQGPAARTPIAAWSGSLRADIPADQGMTGKDVTELKSAGAAKFDPNEKVAVKFEKATLDFFLKQMLGGALGVAYVAPDDMTGSVTLRTEQPITKGQVLQVVRDVLGRNGLEMRYLDGVYQIATSETMTALQQTVGPGRTTDQVTRVVRLHKGSANEVIRFVRQLVPDEITIVPSSGGDSVVIKAPSSELDRVVELVNMSDNNVGDDRIAIIPLRQSSPEKIAQQLAEFYRSQAESATIVALDNQQALLVGAKDRRALQGLKELVKQLDRDTGGDSTLRIIPLVHLSAEEVVPQLTAIFAGGAGPGGGAAVSAGGAAPGQGGASQDISPQAARAPSLVPPVQVPRATGGDEGGFSSPGFALPPSAGAGGGAAAGNGGANGSAPGPGSTAAAIAANLGPTAAPAGVPIVRFVADVRSNAVMVYSSYSLFKTIRDRLKLLDVPQAQVVIEAMVAEVTLNDELSRGVEAFLNAQGIQASSSSTGALTPIPGTKDTPGIPAAGTPSGGAFLHATVGIPGGKVDVILRALQNVTNVKLISTPYLTVVDGKTAKLVIGDEVPFSSSTASTVQATGTTTTTSQVVVKDTGVQLEVTPKIRSNNSALLSINQSVSEVKNNIAANSLTPTISTRSVKSDVIVQSGATIMLAGLIQDGSNKTETSVPVVSRVPIVGELFKQTDDVASRQELIVLITPRVVRNSSQMENITRQMRALVHIR